MIARPTQFFAAILLVAWWPQPTCCAQTQLPTLTIQNGARAEVLSLLEVDLDVRLAGAVAETVLELEFFNHTKRRQEGQFTLQLPDGATVSTYALDIAGSMRPGVSVEKARARRAYETIKRQQIDPGLVEREEGNVYRTRIFPIEPESSKRVRIGFIRNLAATQKPAEMAAGEAFVYRFPLEHDAAVSKFRCRVRGAMGAPDLSIPNRPAAKGAEGDWTWESDGGVKLDGELTAKSRPPTREEPLVVMDAGPEANSVRHFLAQMQFPEGWEPKIANRPERLRLIWDASRSGLKRARKAEFEALAGYWKALGNVEVSLQVLRDRLEPPRVFKIANGDGSALETVLRQVIYDGVADFSQIPRENGVTLLVSAGEVRSPVFHCREGGFADVAYVLTSSGAKLHPGFLKNGAARVNLDDPACIAQLTHTANPIAVKGLDRDAYEISQHGRYLHFTGRFAAPDAAAAELSFAGKVAIRLDPKSAGARDTEWTFARRVWAQNRLSTLENYGNEAAITAFSKAERLVSDFTSLIVLERFEDHLRYRIPPPEPRLLARYLATIGNDGDAARDAALRAWTGKLEWHKTEFPWLDWQLAEQTETVAIWTRSSRKVFRGEKLNAAKIESFEAWLPGANEVVQRKAKLKSQAEFGAWQRDVTRKLDELAAIRLEEVELPDDRPIHVSVRGFVNQRGVYSDSWPLTLREAIDMAGGPYARYVSLTRVYLYRDAQRTGYNLHSRHYRDVSLKWGDMIVVEHDLEGHFQRRQTWLGADPFADLGGGGGGGGGGFGGGGDPTDESAVFEELGTARAGFDPAPDVPDGNSRNQPENRHVGPDLAVRVANSPDQEPVQGLNRQFLAKLRQHPDPAARYLELRRESGPKANLSLATLLEIARLLYTGQPANPALGRQVLSNLFDVYANEVEATRAFAFWLAEFGQADDAAKTLEALISRLDEPEARALVQFDAGQLRAASGNDEAARELFRQSAESELETPHALGIAPIALTDYFARSDLAAGTAGPGALKPFAANAADSDVRIVLNSAGNRVILLVSDPGGMPGVQVGSRNHGGRSIATPRVHEYQMRQGLPGIYRVRCKRTGTGEMTGFEEVEADEDWQPVTIRVTTFTNWAKPGQQSRTQTLLLEGAEMMLDGLEFGWAE